MELPIHIHLKDINPYLIVLIVGVILVCINEFTSGRMWVGIFGGLLMLIGILGIIENWPKK